VAQEWTPAGTALSDGPSAAKVAEVKAYDTSDAVGYDRAYTYDGAQRLTKAADHTATVTGVIFDPQAPVRGLFSGRRRPLEGLAYWDDKVVDLGALGHPFGIRCASYGRTVCGCCRPTSQQLSPCAGPK
jgi:hypothetical protein